MSSAGSSATCGAGAGRDGAGGLALSGAGGLAASCVGGASLRSSGGSSGCVITESPRSGGVKLDVAASTSSRSITPDTSRSGAGVSLSEASVPPLGGDQLAAVWALPPLAALSLVAAAGAPSSLVARHSAKVSVSLPATSFTIPCPIAAARPLRRRSVVRIARVLPFSSVSAMLISALAVPWPRASVALAISLAWWALGSGLTISTSPRYCMETGPSRILIWTL